MTNLEFLRQLSPEQLIRYLTCRACIRKEDNTGCIGFDCKHFMLEWLNEERNEETI